ncbi:MAG: hypothetical protein K1X79_02285 [Oligoflexia bacterium]|nr:hypothetical protein [Oligoflexia bacterium]
MQLNIRLVTFALAALLLSACTPPVSKVEMGRVQNDIGDVRSNQAGISTQVSRLDADLRQLAGRVDEIEHALTRNTSQSEISALREEILRMQRRLPPPSIVPIAALEEDEEAALRFPEETAQPLAEALSAIRIGEFSKAAEQLEYARQSQPSSTASALITFWSAILFEGLADFRSALNAYYDFTQRFPKHSRAALVLLRQSSVLVRLGDQKTAGLVLKKLISEFPKSAEADRAKEKLKGLAA